MEDEKFNDSLDEKTPSSHKSTRYVPIGNKKNKHGGGFRGTPPIRAKKNDEGENKEMIEEKELLEKAEEVGYIDIVLPNEKGQKVKLSEVKGKVVMVYFWASEMGEQKMFNQDVLKPVYRDFKGRGFEIYAISLDTDKAAWATAVRTQNTGWINVCDGLGTASPSVLSYNVNKIPSLFFIVNGELVTGTGVKDEATLRRYLSSKL